MSIHAGKDLSGASAFRSHNGNSSTSRIDAALNSITSMVDADALTRGRRQSVLEGPATVGIEMHCLVVTRVLSPST